MNTQALRRAEITRAVSLLPEKDLEKIECYLATLVPDTQIPSFTRVSLRGIWKNKGFESIQNIELEISSARQQLSQSIVTRKF